MNPKKTTGGLGKLTKNGATMKLGLDSIGLLHFVVIVALIFPVQSLALDWKEHRPTGAGYVVEMPGEWKEEWTNVKTSVGLVAQYQATTQVGETGFVTMFSRYPERLIHSRGPKLMLEGGRDGAVANVKGKLRSEREITVSGYPGKEIIIDALQGVVIAQRVFVRDTFVIQAIAGGPKGVESGPEVRRFLASLRSDRAK